MNYYHIKFKYADTLSGWEWRNQECSLYASCKEEAISKCKNLYGLNDCEYEFLSVEKEVK